MGKKGLNTSSQLSKEVKLSANPEVGTAALRAESGWGDCKYYSAVRKQETLPFVTKWMDPESMMLSEVSQT